jgi:hypothetical protein
MTPQTSTQGFASRTDERDAGLRQAHKRAFDKIRAAATADADEALVAEAVRELVDACEAYIQARR